MKITKPLYYVAILFLIVTVAKLYSCGSNDNKYEDKTEVVNEQAKTLAKKNGIKKLTSDNYWGKKILERRNSIDDLYMQTVEKGIDIYWFNKKISTVGGAKQGYDSPTKQVKSLIAIIPQKLDKKNYWGKKIIEGKGSLDGLYFDVDDNSKSVSVYFYNEPIFKFVSKELGKKGPTEQVKELRGKLPLKLTPNSTWGKLIVKKGVSLDGIFYTKDKNGTFHISKYGIKVGELGLKNKGYDSPTKQVNKLITNIPSQYK